MTKNNDEYSEYEDLIELRGGKKKEPAPHHRVYKLGEEVGAYGVKFWGQEKSEKVGRTAMFICPLCDETWRARVQAIENVKNGTKSCGCQGRRYKKH